MAVGVTARACKHTPIGIATHVVVLPTGFIGVMKSHWDVLVTRFCIKHGLNRIIFPRRIDIHPVVLLRIVRNRIIGIAHALTIATVSALERMEIKPCCLAPPFGRGITSSRMIRHQVVLVYRLNGRSQCFPHLRFDVTLDITTHKPDDVRFVLVTVGKEGAILLGIFYAQFAILHQSAPDANHTDIDAVLTSHIDNIVHVIPIAVDALAVDVLEVPAIHVRHLSVDIISRYAINGLYLYDVIACLRTRLQIPLSLSPV